MNFDFQMEGLSRRHPITLHDDYKEANVTESVFFIPLQVLNLMSQSEKGEGVATESCDSPG